MKDLAHALCVACAVCVTGAAHAEVGTVPSASDARIQTVRFTGDDIIRIAAAEGVVTTKPDCAQRRLLGPAAVPEGDAATPEALAFAKQEADRQQMKADLQASGAEGTLNYDYWIVGPQELQPLSMHDNGRQTFMLFSAAHPMPAAFIMEPDGTESLVDYNVQADTMVLHRVVPCVILRRGALVAGITNKSPILPIQSAPTGTASGKVQRAIREPGGE